MNRFVALCKREWLEHRGGFFWAPVAVLGLALCVVLLGVTVGDFSSSSVVTQGNSTSSEQHSSLGGFLQRALSRESLSDADLSRGLGKIRHGIAQPFILLYLLVTTFVLLGSLYDDRRDRSVLFWKSMPVSDLETVLSKLVTAVWFAPLISIAAILLAYLFALLVGSVLVSGAERGGPLALWSHGSLGMGLLELLFGFFTQGFWTLPLWGWLLLVSALATRLPFLWALLLPLAPMVLEVAAFGSSQVYNFVMSRLQTPALPELNSERPGAGLGDYGLSWIFELWTTSSMWVGIFVGVLFLTAAVFARRRNNEL